METSSSRPWRVTSPLIAWALKLAFVHVHAEAAGDVIGFHVSSICVHVGVGGKALQGHIAMPGG